MQTSHIWNKLDLRWTKVIFLIVIVIGIVTRGNAQGMFGLTSAAGSDDKLISYGFFWLPILRHTKPNIQAYFLTLETLQTIKSTRYTPNLPQDSL